MSNEKRPPSQDENKSPSKFEIVIVVIISIVLMAFMAFSFTIGVVR